MTESSEAPATAPVLGETNTVGATTPRSRATKSDWIVLTLTISSLSLWFWLGFPWQHHNESLVWAIELARASFWDTLASNPITPVQTYRPLGVAMAWVLFSITHQGIWLQQLVNFAITAYAWVLASRSVQNRIEFAWLSFVCNAGFFSGYIYLFHLHGVFYGPLFLYLAYLLMLDRREPEMSWRMGLTQLGVAIVVSLFHTFALLFYAAFLAGTWLQNRVRGKEGGLAIAVACAFVSGILMKLLVSGAPGLGADDPVLGSVVTYRALELNGLLSALSIVLAVLTAITAKPFAKFRALAALGTLVTGAVLLYLGLPAIFAWIAVCLCASLFQRNFAMSALIGATALLSVATATGSPTYGLFTLMTCVCVTADALPTSDSMIEILRKGAVAAIAAAVLLFVSLRADVHIPLVSNQVLALRAEGEKTQQMMQVFDWIDAQPTLKGHLQLCQPGDFPVRSNDAIVRTFRAPTHAWPFDEYVKARFGPRVAELHPELLLCFGGQRPPDTSVVHVIEGRWAGDVALLTR